ncbi:hypothetical protein [Propioniciclava sp. MC1683]|nr:hypothetical protein [Propioniciclava sp. MC1683]
MNGASAHAQERWRTRVQVRPAEGADLEATKKVALTWLDAAE